MSNAHQTQQLEKRIAALSEALAKLGDAEDFMRLLKQIHFPGWTTPAEFMLVSSIVDTMLGQAQVLSQLKTDLARSASALGEKSR